MKNPVIKLAIVAVGFLIAIVAFNLLRKTNSGAQSGLNVIGEIRAVEGQVERRLPRTVNMETVPSPRPLYDKDLVLTQKNSSATLVFQPSGTTLKLKENTRFVAEQDPLKPGAIIGTLLDGDIQMINSGSQGSFKLYREGREVALDALDREMVPLIPNESIGTQTNAMPTPGIVISATLPDEPVGGQPRPTAIPQAQSASADVLTNDDIVRQLKTQTGFFQRCYLNFIHRTQNSAGAGPQTGTVTVSFMIQMNGKVSDVKVVRSDFKDNTLHNCVSEVIERTVYRGFKGNPVPVLEFPIALQ